MKKKKKKVTIILVSVMAIAAIIAAVTYKATISSYHSKEVADNKFTAKDLDITIKEDVNNDEVWRGNPIKKEVKVKNGEEKNRDYEENMESANVVLRVSLIPRWVDEKDKAWPGDISYLRYNFSDSLFIASDISIPLDKAYWVSSKPDLNEEQYFYYNGILKADEETELLLKEIYLFTEDDYEKLSPEEKLTSGNYMPRSLNDRYKGKKVMVEVKAEAVQAKEDAIKSVWGETTGNSKIDEMLKTLCEGNK